MGEALGKLRDEKDRGRCIGTRSVKATSVDAESRKAGKDGSTSVPMYRSEGGGGHRPLACKELAKDFYKKAYSRTFLAICSPCHEIVWFVPT
jgi:hypothetical protein